MKKDAQNQLIKVEINKYIEMFQIRNGIERDTLRQYLLPSHNYNNNVLVPPQEPGSDSKSLGQHWMGRERGRVQTRIPLMIVSI